MVCIETLLRSEGHTQICKIMTGTVVDIEARARDSPRSDH